jgi:hypothetical protein
MTNTTKTNKLLTSLIELAKTQGYLFYRDVASHFSLSEDMEEEEIGGRIDYASTLEQAYDNLQGMIGNDGIQSLTKDTQNLISQQKSLMGTMSDMGPMLKMAKETLGSFNGGEMKEAMESLGNIMGGFKKQ